MKQIDALLNRFTIYKIVQYGLRFLAGVSLVFSFIGLIPFNPINLTVSLCFLITLCFTFNKLFAKFFKVTINPESYAITALILFLILTPVNSVQSTIVFTATSLIAMGSKYLIAINKRHIFNPSAFALVVIGLLGASQGEWWVGNRFMFPFVLIVGLLIVRKVRKFQLFASYVVFALISIAVFAFKNKLNVPETLIQAITSWPFLFLGTVMLTEPITMPPTKNKQLVYGALVGVLSGSQFAIGPIFSTSELALVIGNVYSYIVGFKRRLILTFKDKVKIAPTIYEFVFTKNKALNYLPGQYMDWTLSHDKPDRRGVKRFFTISSSPTEEDVRLGVKIEENSSTFKKTLFNLTPGKKVYAGELSGDFVLPQNSNNKYVFIAGGIGVTPFRSIIKSLIDKNELKDIVLFYVCGDSSEFVYKSIFDSAEQNGVKTIYVCSRPPKDWNGKSGRIDGKMIKEEVSDFKNRIYYLSGPSAMVDGYKKILRDLGIKSNKIVTDYFPGY